VAHAALQEYQRPSKMPYYVLNFQDLMRSHRCNPLSPENIPTLAHAEEYARTIVSNLDPASIRHREFFSNSATAWLAALIWFFRSEHPHLSTLPHVINTVLFQDYTQVISMLETNPQSADMIRSIATAIENKAEKQLAGVIASLQIMVSRINSPEIAWVLSGDDFNLNINDPADPKLLCIGSDPGLTDTLSPVISLIITVALKRMNQQGRHNSFVLLDEAPTLYIPRFEVIPATARSNRIASVFMAQDYSQMQDMFGREKSAVIVANLSNQFYGKTSTLSTAKTVSEMIGSQAQWQTHYSKGNSRDSKGRHNLTYNTSHSLHERILVKPQEIMQLSTGEFVGRTVESKLPYFWDRVKLSEEKPSAALMPFVSFDIGMVEIVAVNFHKIRKEVEELVSSYPIIYR
jgi:type IV secretory pathway TraG/TraD family ATPase VirD4